MLKNSEEVSFSLAKSSGSGWFSQFAQLYPPLCIGFIFRLASFMEAKWLVISNITVLRKWKLCSGGLSLRMRKMISQEFYVTLLCISLIEIRSHVHSWTNPWARARPCADWLMSVFLTQSLEQTCWDYFKPIRFTPGAPDMVRIPLCI